MGNYSFVPVLETVRCSLYRVMYGDFKEVCSLYEDEEVREYMGGVITGHLASRRFNQMVNSMYPSHYWSIRRKECGRWMGIIFLEWEEAGDCLKLGYMLSPAYWGYGYATEVCSAVLDFGFDELLFKEIGAVVNNSNRRSINVLRKLGMSCAVKDLSEGQSKYAIRKSIL
ncbi:GNAT family N-acetyltransferase [Bacillus sp. 1P06AnD]|uniref:GNAT family N-acetyltransferase n=1 Tax=Bacillus sp. 1P06AnD TaxID=3132208 RepID=UPI0039A1F0FE